MRISDEDARRNIMSEETRKNARGNVCTFHDLAADLLDARAERDHWQALYEDHVRVTRRVYDAIRLAAGAPTETAVVWALVKGAFAALTEEERREIVRGYCRWCLTRDPRCQCSNDEQGVTS